MPNRDRGRGGIVFFIEYPVWLSRDRRFQDGLNKEIVSVFGACTSVFYRGSSNNNLIVRTHDQVPHQQGQEIAEKHLARARGRMSNHMPGHE